MIMPLLNAAARRFLGAVSNLVYANPFLPGVIEQERIALGPEAVDEEPLRSMTVRDPDRVRTNSWTILKGLDELLPKVRDALRKGVRASESEALLYEDGLLYAFYYRYYERLLAATFPAPASSPPQKDRTRWLFYREFRDEWQWYFDIPGLQLPSRNQPAHTFACYYQILRAFHHIFEQIIGNSHPAARLRAAIWQSVFTHDIRRYRRTLFARMSEFATLITGPSGTGKELVARTIALSRYVPFDEARLAFTEDLNELFYPINLAALPGTLVESELFGHKRGAFTGAVQDKRGWLEACPPLGAVFLDEIGDLNPEIQVKLLRVIETRRFQPLGESTGASRSFSGKLIAATNRDLDAAIRDGGFREDFYYRLCSDQITTPSLRQQIDESPEVLQDLILFMAKRVAGPEAEQLAEEASAWIADNLDPHYEWPGNYRELEQFVRNILIRKEYRAARRNAASTDTDLFSPATAGAITASELLSRYCTLVYSQTRSYEDTARRLQIDRRTAKAKIDWKLLEQLTTKA